MRMRKQEGGVIEWTCMGRRVQGKGRKEINVKMFK
jgi:hypothetical protein